MAARTRARGSTGPTSSRLLSPTPLRSDVSSALLDGEAVVLDAEGRTSFQALQNALKEDSGSILYYAFDLLALDGEDLTDRPLTERKEKLATLIGSGMSKIRYSDHIVGRGEELFGTFCEAGLEGVISKRADAKYVGSRSGSWVKTKCIKRQEFVIVGWTPSDKQRGFRALLLGVNEDGKLRYAGKAGTGYTADEIDRLMGLMGPLEVKTPTVEAPRAAVRGAHWIQPKLVAEIAFMEITGDGVLRHSSYLGLRLDKKAEAVVVEKEAPVAEVEAAATAPAATKVRVTNRERVIFPEGRITKGELADYYQAVSGIMLPWAGSRPISLVRCPQGRGKKCFFQKHDAGSFGDRVHHVGIREKDGHDESYLFIDDAEGLVTCVQMGTIEYHGWGRAHRGCREGRPAGVRSRSGRGPRVEGRRLGRLPRPGSARPDGSRHLSDGDRRQGRPRHRAAHSTSRVAGGQGLRAPLRTSAGAD